MATKIKNLTLPNELCLLLFMPKWVGSGIAVLCLYYTVMASFRLIGVDWRRSDVVPLMLSMWYFLMPWQNHMGGLVYQFNYLL